MDSNQEGSEAKLSCLGHGLIENRNGLLVGTLVTPANGTAERDAALLLAEKSPAKTVILDCQPPARRSIFEVRSHR